MNLSAFQESLTKLLAHGELAVEMVMLNCNKRQQKYKVSEGFKADPEVMMNYMGVIPICWDFYFPLDYLFSKPVALLQDCILC